MPSPVYGNPVRMAAMQTQQLATTASLSSIRSTDMPRQAASLQVEQGRLEATARMFRQSQLVGTILDVVA